MAGGRVAFLAWRLSGVKRVIEGRSAGDDLLVAAYTSLVRDRIHARARELRVASHVRDDFLKSDELVQQASDRARIDVAFDARDALV